MQMIDFPTGLPARRLVGARFVAVFRLAALHASLAILACAIGWSSASIGWAQVPTAPLAGPFGAGPQQGAVQQSAVQQSAVQSAAGQVSASPAIGQGVQERRAAKPAIDGQTFVALDQTLDHVYNGWAPQTIEELRALESQQSKVAAAIQNVTVNVRQGVAQGSGVLIRDGYVLTAAHVGGKPKRDATVVLSDGTELKAEVLGMNRNVDAGLLKIVDPKAKNLPYATLGKSSALKAGQWVIGSGHPGGWVSGRGAVIRVGRVLSVLSDTIISDVALIGGDSGGPLFNLRGELVGIHSRIGTDVVDNMHVPIDTFESDWKRLRKGEAWGVLPGYAPVIGVSGQKGETQAIIGEVTKGGPAFKAGVEPGDIVLRFDGQAIATFEDLQNAVRATLPGDGVRMKIRRGDQELNLFIVIGVAEQ